MNICSPTLTSQDCLQVFFQANQFTADNMYSSDKCGKSVSLSLLCSLLLFDLNYQMKFRLRNEVKSCRVLQLSEVNK